MLNTDFWNHLDPQMQLFWRGLQKRQVKEQLYRRDRLRNRVIRERLGRTRDIIARIQQSCLTLNISFKWSRGDIPNWHYRAATGNGNEVEEDQKDGWIG